MNTTETKVVAVMDGVREYVEGPSVASHGVPVQIIRTEQGRLAIEAFNEAGSNATQVDLIDLLGWLWARGAQAKDEELRLVVEKFIS